MILSLFEYGSRQMSRTQKCEYPDSSGLVGIGWDGASLGKPPLMPSPVGQRWFREACTCAYQGYLRSHTVHVGRSFGFMECSWPCSQSPCWISRSALRPPPPDEMTNPVFDRPADFGWIGIPRLKEVAGDSGCVFFGFDLVASRASELAFATLTGVSNTRIGDSGAWTLSHPQAFPIMHSLFSGCDLAPLSPVLALFLFCLLCSALKNRIGSSGAVACKNSSLRSYRPSIFSINWVLPMLLYVRLWRDSGRTFCQAGLLRTSAIVPGWALWKILGPLLFVIQLMGRTELAAFCTEGSASLGISLSGVILCALFRLLVQASGLKQSLFGRCMRTLLTAGHNVPMRALAECAQVEQPILNWKRGHHKERHSSLSSFAKNQRPGGKQVTFCSSLFRLFWWMGACTFQPFSFAGGATSALYSAVWLLPVTQVGASIIPFDPEQPNDLEPDELNEAFELLGPEEDHEGRGLLLGENEWAPGGTQAITDPPFAVPANWPSAPPHQHSRRPLSESLEVVRLPVTGPEESLVASGRWLGIVVYAPYYQLSNWAVRLQPDCNVQDVMERLLMIGSDLFDEGIDTIIPINPPRYRGFGCFLAYPKCMGLLEGCRQVAAIVDASCVGGHYFAAALPHELNLGELLAYLKPQLHVDFDQLLVYVGCSPNPASEREPLILEDGDAITVLSQGYGPPRPFDMGVLFDATTELGQLQHIPRYSYAPGYCLIHQGERWLMHARYHSGRSPAQAVAFYLDCDVKDLTIGASGDFVDLDLLGEPCNAIICAVKLPSPDSGRPLHDSRLDVFTFLDFRPLGYKPHVHFSHSYHLHIPTLLALYDILLPAGYGLTIAGGVVHRDFVVVPGHSTLLFRAFPLDDRRLENTEPAESGAIDFRGFESPDAGARTPPAREPVNDASPAGSGDVRQGRSRSPRSQQRAGQVACKPLSTRAFEMFSAFGSDLCARPQKQSGSNVPGLGLGSLPVLFTPSLTLAHKACERNTLLSSGLFSSLFGSRHPDVKQVPLVCKLATVPDLTVQDNDGEGLTHEDHLRLLLQPFGGGNPPAGIPPALMQQAAEEASDDDTEFIRAMFVIMTPDYFPDVVVVPLRPPATLPDAMFELESVRIPERRRRFTWLSPAQPQLTNAYAVIVALPEWLEDLVAVFDLRTVNGTAFSECVPPIATREELLAIAGLGAAYVADVFVHVAQNALLPGQQVALWTGVTVVIAEVGHDLEVGRTIEDMLLSPDGWNPDAPLPLQDTPAFLLLTDEGQARFPLNEARRAETRYDIAAHIAYDVRLLTLRGVRPRPTDHCSRGWASSAYVVATQRLPRSTRRDVDPRVLVFDLRPLVQGLTWELTSAVRIPLSAIRNRYAHLCPPGFHIEVEGCQFEGAGGERAILLGEAQRVIITLEPDVDDAFSSDSSGDDSDRDSSFGPDDSSLPSRPRNPSRSRSPRPPEHP